MLRAAETMMSARHAKTLPLLVLALSCVPMEEAVDTPEGTEPSSSGTLSCDGYTPCGGDLLGSWTSTGSCGEGPSVLPECQGATVVHAGSTTSIITFGREGHGELNVEATQRELTQIYTQDCVSATYGAPYTQADLAVLCDGLTVELGASEGVVGNCQMSGQSCACEMVMEPVSSRVPFTYSIEGEVVVITTAEGGTSISPYCVDGDTLYLEDPDSGAVTVATRR